MAADAALTHVRVVVDHTMPITQLRISTKLKTFH